jgi:prepilin-type N-terminal cleavage/methylation domain-containing protein/prepilin-type processing-associated H-X9-DG protein
VAERGLSMREPEDNSFEAGFLAGPAGFLEFRARFSGFDKKNTCFSPGRSYLGRVLSSSPMKKSATAAFTLIELLVVIAIIALLAALAIPSIAASIERAKALTDSNQLRSLGQIFERYLSDHDDSLPSLTGAGAGTSWPEQFHKITSDYKIFLSPFDKRQVTNSTGSPVSYGINHNAFGIDRSDINSPSEFMIMAPLAAVGSGSKPVFSGAVSNNVSFQPTNTHGIYRITSTNSYMNVLFADWHVLPMSYQLEFTDTSSVKGKKHWDPKYQEN